MKKYISVISWRCLIVFAICLIYSRIIVNIQWLPGVSGAWNWYWCAAWTSQTYPIYVYWIMKKGHRLNYENNSKRKSFDQHTEHWPFTCTKKWNCSKCCRTHISSKPSSFSILEKWVLQHFGHFYLVIYTKRQCPVISTENSHLTF